MHTQLSLTITDAGGKDQAGACPDRSRALPHH